MSDVSPKRVNIPTPAVQFLAAVSESLAQSLAGVNNFINYFQLDEKRFNLNGNYATAVLPLLAADMFNVFEFNSQIIDVWLMIRTAGTSGVTSLDLKITNNSGGTWTSIFTTLPSISFQAGDYAYVGSVNPGLVGPAYNPSPAYSVPANTTQGVLNSSLTNLIPAWSAIRCDIITTQGGLPDGCAIAVRYRPV